MNKILSIVAVVSILSLGFVTASNAKSMARSGFTTYDTLSLIGSPVKALDGVELGTIYYLVVDSNGHVDFVTVLLPNADEFSGGPIIVPFSTLKITKAKSDKFNVVFNADKQKFYSGPSAGYTNIDNPREAARVDRHYGVAPYWTGATGKSEHHK